MSSSLRLLLLAYLLFLYFHVVCESQSDVEELVNSLIISPQNNSRLHYIRNDTNHTSSVLLFAQNVSLPAIPKDMDYAYFLCFQLFVKDKEELKEETELKCFKSSIPNYPFNITDLTNGVYHIKASLLLASQSNTNDIIIIKKELIIFHIKEMIDYHATYEWSKISDYHSIINGLDVKMDLYGNDSSKLVKIPTQWILQLFVSSSYRLLWLLVSKSTYLSSIKYQISMHTGIDYGCIDITQNGKILKDYDTIESVDWFYNKYNTFIGLESSLFCEPIECGFGYLNKLNTTDSNNSCSPCDYQTLQYKKAYAQNKGKMWIDLTNKLDFIHVLPPNLD